MKTRTASQDRRNKSVPIDLKDYRAMQETLGLLAIPGMRKSIRAGLKVPASKLSKVLKWSHYE